MIAEIVSLSAYESQVSALMDDLAALPITSTLAADPDDPTRGPSEEALRLVVGDPDVSPPVTAPIAFMSSSRPAR